MKTNGEEGMSQKFQFPTLCKRTNNVKSGRTRGGPHQFHGEPSSNTSRDFIIAAYVYVKTDKWVKDHIKSDVTKRDAVLRQDLYIFLKENVWQIFFFF